jgi:uncharacterized membrane protein
MLNHVPMIGVIFGILILLFAKLRDNRDNMIVGLWMLVLAAVFTVPVYLTGDYAASDIREHPTFVKGMVEEHEDAAVWAFILVGALGVAALFGLTFAHRQKKPPKWLPVTVMILSLLTAATFIRTAQLGGLISHPELRSGFVAPPFLDEDD